MKKTSPNPFVVKTGFRLWGVFGQKAGAALLNSIIKYLETKNMPDVDTNQPPIKVIGDLIRFAKDKDDMTWQYKLVKLERSLLFGAL